MFWNTAMRRLLALFGVFAIAATGLPLDQADAQSRRESDRERAERAKADAERRKEQAKKDWNPAMAPLPGQRNAGPCPFVKVLYDAARYVEFQDEREASAAVVWSGEIDGVRADCRYRGDDPIDLDVDVVFSLGKGPQAQGDRKSYRYWVAVTDRNRSVLAKEYFDVEARFDKGEDRTRVVEKLRGITIPRAEETTSGANFEVLVGFDVTEKMAAFNRDGKRFRVNAGQQAAARTGGTSR
jgi:hypothetical protein